MRHGIKAQSLGVDGVSIDGFECACHPGEDDVPQLVLIPAAALALGADGINMGTRFMCTVESASIRTSRKPSSPVIERGTELTPGTLHNTARVASNVVSREVVEILKGGRRFEDVKALVAGVSGRRVFDDGDVRGHLDRGDRDGPHRRHSDV